MNGELSLERQLEILIDRRDDAMCHLEQIDRRNPINLPYVRDLADLHSKFALNVYYFKKRHDMFDYNKINGDYR